MGRELKTNQRSIRFSNEIKEIIDSQIGENFSDKFERLVYNCYIQVEQKKKEAEDWTKRIEEQRNKYYDLVKQLREVSDLIKTLETIKHYGEIAARNSEMIAKNLDHRGLPKEEVTQKAERKPLGPGDV